MNARLEAAAKALLETERANASWTRYWDDASENVKARFRKIAAAVLAAADALDTTEWAVRTRNGNEVYIGGRDVWETFAEANAERAACDRHWPKPGPHYVVSRRAAGSWVSVTEGNDQ